MYLCWILKAHMSYHAIIPLCQCLIIWRISDTRIIFHFVLGWATFERSPAGPSLITKGVSGLHKFSWGKKERKKPQDWFSCNFILSLYRSQTHGAPRDTTRTADMTAVLKFTALQPERRTIVGRARSGRGKTSCENTSSPQRLSETVKGQWVLQRGAGSA